MRSAYYHLELTPESETKAAFVAVIPNGENRNSRGAHWNSPRPGLLPVVGTQCDRGLPFASGTLMISW